MALNEYAYGDHVADENAFVLRCRNIEALRKSRVVMVMSEPRIPVEDRTFSLGDGDAFFVLPRT